MEVGLHSLENKVKEYGKKIKLKKAINRRLRKLGGITEEIYFREKSELEIKEEELEKLQIKILLEKNDAKARAIDTLPPISNWNELCLSKTNGLAIYINKKGMRGRDYSYVELQLGDKRKNAMGKPSKIWHSIRFYAFGEGEKEKFGKNDLSRANKALKKLFPNADGKPFPIKSINIIKRDAMDRKTVKCDPDYWDNNAGECYDEAVEKQYSIRYKNETENENK